MANPQSSKASGTHSKSSSSSAGGSANRARQTDAETGERDENYNLISVLYHALQGAQNCAQYARDAEEAGDDELVQFLQEARTSQVELAARGKQLLAARIDETDEEDDDSADDDD
jgi:hypothetical protein